MFLANGGTAFHEIIPLALTTEADSSQIYFSPFMCQRLIFFLRQRTYTCGVSGMEGLDL